MEPGAVQGLDEDPEVGQGSWAPSTLHGTSAHSPLLMKSPLRPPQAARNVWLLWAHDLLTAWVSPCGHGSRASAKLWALSAATRSRHLPQLTFVDTRGISHPMVTLSTLLLTHRQAAEGTGLIPGTMLSGLGPPLKVAPHSYQPTSITAPDTGCTPRGTVSQGTAPRRPAPLQGHPAPASPILELGSSPHSG